MRENQKEESVTKAQSGNDMKKENHRIHEELAHAHTHTHSRKTNDNRNSSIGDLYSKHGVAKCQRVVVSVNMLMSTFE